MSGWDNYPRAGYPDGDPQAPADLAAVQADDTLLDMLGSVGDTPIDADDELTRVLAAWRREVRDEPVEELVDTDTAVAVIRAARRPVRHRNPVFGSIAAAAAVFVIAFSGVGLFAKSAEPNDQLWGVTQVLYPDYARSVETAAAVKTELAVADQALKEGKPEKARESLKRVQQQLPVIAEAEDRAGLTTLHHRLEQQLAASPATDSDNPPTAPGSTEPGSASRTPRPDTQSQSGQPSTSPQPTPTPTPTTDPDSTAVEPPPPTPGPDACEENDPRPPCYRPNADTPQPPPTDGPGPGDGPGRAVDEDPRDPDPDEVPGPQGIADPAGTPGGAGNVGDPGDAGEGRPGAGNFMPPRPYEVAQPPFSARTASVYPRQYSQVTYRAGSGS
ncbi:MAG: anti-sigma-D factor RsdA [Pseudonocardiaceae bacterium]